MGNKCFSRISCIFRNNFQLTSHFFSSLSAISYRRLDIIIAILTLFAAMLKHIIELQLEQLVKFRNHEILLLQMFLLPFIFLCLINLSIPTAIPLRVLDIMGLIISYS